MDVKLSPRHSRRGFTRNSKSAGLATALSHYRAGRESKGGEMIDFSPAPDEITASAGTADFYAMLADELSALPPGPVIDCSPTSPADMMKNSCLTDDQADSNLQIERFENGGSINKTARGRVEEIHSGFGDSLYLQYNEAGELSAFRRKTAAGDIHSTGSKDIRGITVRDGQGRVKAVGEHMSVDPWGRFYLHTHDGQYYALDLVAGIHSERRRLVDRDGQLSYVTATFAHDGFRMSTVYTEEGETERNIVYRFYGRDGTCVEFDSENEFRDLNAARSMPPGTMPVHKSWMQHRQAQTAWESINECLNRQLLQVLAP